MRIGVIASPWVPVPPPAYGGTESVVHNLCVGLDQRGHEVYLVTVGESTCPVMRTSVFDHPPAAIGEPASEIVHARAAYALLQDVDVIHDHTTIGPQLLPESINVPVVTTVHGPFWPETRMMHATRPSGLSLVAISHAQRAMAPEVDVEAVIHHGIDLDRHRPGPGGGGFLMFIGRMSPDKGPDRAIEVARRAGMPLVLTAKMRSPSEISYFEERVRPLLGPDVTFLGEADLGTRLDLLRQAEALVNPIRWPEPFGLVMAEALACATPVLALPYGAAPEIVDDGVTGFLCDDLDDMVAAVGQLDRIDRAACRQAVEDRFSVDRMAADHEALYERLVERARADRADDLALAGMSAVSRVDTVAEPAGAIAIDGRSVIEGVASAAANTVTSFDQARARARRRFAPRRRPLGSLGPAADPVAEH
jgi:glycosyltransferase involved in cell wall biosynthesis